MEAMGTFVRAMLNTPVSESYTAQIFVARKLGRLDASPFGGLRVNMGLIGFWWSACMGGRLLCRDGKIILIG